MIARGSFEYWIIFAATCFVVVVKFFMLIYIEIRIRKQNKENSTLSTIFMRATWILILCLFISRIFYMIFDFYLTSFDESLYFLEPNIWYWKAGQFIVGIGLATMVFVVDRKILDFKLKGIISYIILIGSIITLLIPVANEQDFNFVSIISSLPQVGIVVVAIVFINIALKTSGAVKKTASILIIAFILYGLSAIVVNAALIDVLDALLAQSSTQSIETYTYIIQAAGKSIGNVLIPYGASRFGKSLI
jgi:hypothetical protein